jgi:hypothetical protein
MRKSYGFKKLGRQVQRLAAIMLVTLMAVGNVFAEYDGTGLFTKINSTDELTTGYYVITDETGAFAMLNTGTNFINKTDAVFLAPPASIVWYVNVDADGNVSLYNEEAGKYVEYHGSGNNAYLVETMSDQCSWTPTLNEAGWILANVATPARILSYNANNPRFAAYGNTGQKRLAFYKQGPAPTVMAPTFNLPSATYFTPQTVELTCVTPGANIYYTVNGSEPVLYTVPFTVSATAEVTAYSVLGEDQSLVNTLTLTFPAPLANIAAFYAAENGPYTITSDMTFVYRNGRYMYVKDATGGLLIYDSFDPVITTEYNEGDVFTGGITGTRSPYAGLVEIVPALNTAEGTAGAAVAPIEVTAAQLLANPDNYMSQLVVMKNGTFNGGVLNNSSNPKKFSQDGNDIVIYNRFSTLTNDMMPQGQTATVVGFVSTYNGTVQLFPRDANDIALTTIPFTSTFGSASAFNWTLVNGDETNKWYIGEAQGFDNSKLYVSSSNGLTNKYNVSATSTVHAYEQVTLPNSDVLLTFDVRCVGEANDYLQVTVMDAAPEAGVVPTNSLTRIYGVSEFGARTVLIPASYAGEKYIVFTWHNNNAGGQQQPAAIDNVALYPTCTQVSNIEATVNEHTAVVTWNAPAGQTAWTLEYKDANSDAWQTVNATAPSVTLNNLSTEVTYDVRVRCECGSEGSSAWTNAQFYVPCIALTSAPVEITIGTGTSTSSTTPMNAYYKNSWTQMVYPKTEFPSAGYINSLSWYVGTSNTHNYSTLKIYLGTKSSAINESTSDWVPMEDLTLVYESTNGTVGSTVGWETFTLSTPYYYNGEDNLVVVTSRTADAYKSLNYRYTSVTNSVLYRRSDSSPESYASHPGSNTGTRAANLPNMMVDYLGYVCGDEHCAAPTELTVNHITTTSAILNWEAGNANAWKVNYKKADADQWTTVDVTDNTYTLTDLDQNTDYVVRVMANCGTLGLSSEATAAFTTVADCPAPINLAVEHHTANTVVTWVGVPGVTSYELQCTATGSNLWNTVTLNNVTSFIINGLTEGASYDVRVRTICGENETSEWVSTTFVRPVYCAVPADIHTTAISHNGAALTWDAGEGTSWTVEFGEAGFTLGEGTQVTTNTNSVNIIGLDEQTAYDVYVKANCGGYLGAWSNAYTFTTECAPLTITETTPWTEDFEGYTGSGEQTLDICWKTPLKVSSSPFVYCNYAAASHSGANSLEMKASTNQTVMVALPAFTNPLQDLQMTYYARLWNQTPGTVEVGYITDPADATTFVAVQTVEPQQGSYGRANAMLYGPFSFPGVTLTNARIAIRFTSAASNTSWNMDDFTVFIPQSCPAPMGIAASDVTTESAVINWIADNAVSSWQVQYGVSGFALGTGTVANATTNTYTINGLNDGTAYDVYVKSVCGANDESIWVGPYTFETAPSCTETCTFTLVLADTYGDGWNGGEVTISQNGQTVGTYTIEDGYDATYTVTLCKGIEAVVEYTQGSYPTENSFQLKDDNNFAVVSHSGGAGNLNQAFTPNCGQGPVECTTTCAYTLVLDDSYGDGWNGGSVVVTQVGVSSESYTIDDGYAETFTLNLCSGVAASFTYVPGSYATENSLILKDPDGNVIWSHNGADGTGNFAVTPDCGGDEPTGCERSCDYTFVLTDSYGDGWGGSSYGTVIGSVEVIQDNATVATLTMDEGSTATYTVNLCDSTATTILVHPDYWASETGMTVYDPEGNVVWNFDGSDLDDFGNAPDQTFNFTTDCGDAVACVAPTELVLDAVAETTATLSWTGDPAVTYEFSYKTSTADVWATTTVTATTVTLTGLTPNTTYFARVKAVCDINNTYSNEVMFFPTVSSVVCASRHFGSQSRSEYYMPVNDYYRNSYTQQIYTPNEVGVGLINKISFNYAHTAAMTKKTNVEIYMGHTDKAAFSTTSDWVTTGLQLVYTGSLNCTHQGWNEFVLDQTFNYNGTDNLVIAVRDNSGDYDGSAFKFYLTNTTGYQGMSWQNDSQTWTNQTGTRRTYKPDVIFGICGPAEDMKLDAIHNIPNACELSGIDVTIDVKNVGDTTLTAFEAYYCVNGGAVVHESVTMPEPLAIGGVYTYTFNAPVTMTDPANILTAWVATDGDRDASNNILSTDPINVIEAQNVPFVETFNAGEMNDGWFVRDINNDEVTFNIANGVATYTYNDEMNADDWLMTSCLYVPAGRYDVSYSYNAIDPTMTENFGVYYGKKVGDNYVMNNLIAEHEFSNANFVTAHNMIEVAESGVYYFGIHASSIAGNAGFNINDFSIKPTIHFTAYAAEHGNVVPEGSIEVAAGEPYTITILPDNGYHVLAIYKNMFQVMGENQNNASVQYFTFTPNNGDNIYVTFTGNHYEVNATVSNLYVTPYNDNAAGATYTPNHEVVAHGGSHTGIITLAEHYHLVYVTVNGMDVTSDLIALNGNQYQLTLNNIWENKDIYVLAGLDSTTITYTVLAGEGTINNEFVVDANTTLPAVYTVTLPGYSDLLSTITPAPGYHISSIIIDGVEHSLIDIYSFEHLFGTHTVEVIFSPNHYVITTAGYGNGTVTPGVEFDYDPDFTYTFQAVPAAGYRIGTITRNNVALNVINPADTFTETLTNILDNYHYEVMFVQNTYTITASCGAHGTISPNGVANYLYHQDASYVITANPGYYIATVTYDGTTYTFTQDDAITTFTVPFLNIEENHTISATFAPMSFQITVNAGSNGAITPTTASYAYGATPTFTITPDAGYSIADVTVDGNSVGAVATYTFLPLTAAHTIGATFVANIYTITATAGNGGTITPAGATAVAYNADRTYTIAANTGYHVSDVFVDGVSVGAVTTYTFTGVTANHTIYAAFDLNEYTVTVNQPAHGAITPGTTTVLYGATPSFVITPATGYNVTAITVNGSNVNLNNVPSANGIYTYTFSAISSNQTITATMTAKTYTISASAGANGSITPNGNTTVSHGGAQAYTITPANGYVVAQVTVDGMSVGAVTSYVFTNVVANHTINATFQLAECEAPSYLYATHIDSTSAELHWSHPTATTFNIQYKTPTGNLTSVSAVSGNSYLLTGLTPATTYLWQVQAICAGNNLSDWANLMSFQTDNTTIDETGIEDLVKNNIKVYAEHQNVHILNNAGMNIENVRIFDAYGKLIYSGAVNTAHEVINLSVAAGAYIVNVTTDEGVANYKVTILK